MNPRLNHPSSVGVVCSITSWSQTASLNTAVVVVSGGFEVVVAVCSTKPPTNLGAWDFRIKDSKSIEF